MAKRQKRGMTVESYIDGIVGLLLKAGVPQAEIDQNMTENKLYATFQKGVAFEDAARAVCKEHGVEIK